MFLVVSSSFPHSGIRKRGGGNDNLSLVVLCRSLQLASYQNKPCNQGSHSVVKTTNLFYSDIYKLDLNVKQYLTTVAQLQQNQIKSKHVIIKFDDKLSSLPSVL